MNLQKHEEEQLSKDFQLLKELEDAHRSEINPRTRLKLEKDIQELKEKVNDRQASINLLLSLRNSKDGFFSGFEYDFLFTESPTCRVSKKSLSDISKKIEDFSTIKKIRNKRLEISKKINPNFSLKRKILFLSGRKNLETRTLENFFGAKPVKKSFFIEIFSHLGTDWKLYVDIENMISDGREVKASIGSIYDSGEAVERIIDINKYIDQDLLDIYRQVTSEDFFKVQNFLEFTVIIQTLEFINALSNKTVEDIETLNLIFSGDALEFDSFKKGCSILFAEWKKIVDLDHLVEKALFLRVSLSRQEDIKALLEESPLIVEEINKRRKRAINLAKELSQAEKVKVLFRILKARPGHSLPLAAFQKYFAGEALNKSSFEKICSLMDVQAKEVSDFDFMIDLVWVQTVKNLIQEKTTK